MIPPVFVLGAQRTGSTLIGRMLAAMPDSVVTVNGKIAYYLYLYVPPLPHWWRWIEHLRIDEIVHAIRRKPPYNAPENFIDRIAEGLAYGRRDLLTRTHRPTRAQAIAELVHAAYATLAPRCQLWGDKYNEYVLQLDDLHASFPNAKLVWTVRDANASGRSAVRAFAGRPWAPETQGEGARRYSIWSRMVSEFAATHPHARIFKLDYDALLANPFVELRNLDAALELGGKLAVLSHWVQRDYNDKVSSRQARPLRGLSPYQCLPKCT